MNRRTFLLGMLASMTLPLPALSEQKDLTLVLATDLHYISPELTDNGPYFTRMVENADGKVMTKIEPLTEAFVEEMIAMKPDALILSGDLTFNGAKQSHEDLGKKLLRIREAGVAVYALPGNHDLNMRIAARFEGDGHELVSSVTADEFADLYRDLGYSAAIARDAHSLSYAAQLRPGLRLLMIDVNTPEAPGALTGDMLAFARAQLESAKAAGDRVIAVTHQNLLQHNVLFSNGFVIENREPLLALYEGAGVLLNLSGHMHAQHIAASPNGLVEIATSALCVSPNQYGVITVRGGSLSYRTQTVGVSDYAKAASLTDPDLVDFPTFSDAFFKLTTIRQAQAIFGDSDDGKALADYLAAVNACYFSGRMDLCPVDEALLDRWMEQGAFFSSYLRSIFAEPAADHTTCTRSF